MKSDRYPMILLFIYGILWFILAFNVFNRFDWFLENILVVIILPFFIYTYRSFRLSNISYTLLFIFMCLHAFGSHYTYAEVPFGFWLSEVFGFGRNHFDRIVHFSFGLLWAYPIRELFLRVALTKGFWGYYLPFDVTLAFSALYEIIEWVAAIVVAPEAGIAFLGSQGDVWDAQKDMGLAGLGAFLTMSLTMLINYRYHPGFKKEFWESLKIKRKKPLGEVRLSEYGKVY